MKSMIVHAPVPSIPRTRILDVGCGTGAVTVELGRAFPFASVLGLDNSPVPPLFPKPTNVEYVQSDFFDLSRRDDDERFRSASFDHVFNRCLIFGMTQWPLYVTQVASLLKSGGWAEMHEFDRRYMQDGEPVDGSWKWKQTFDHVAESKGFDMFAGANIERRMREAGLVDVQRHVYKAPIGSWMIKTHPESATYGELLGSQEVAFNQKYLAGMLEDTEHTAGEIADLQVECERTLKQTERLYFNFVVTIGRKP